MKIRETLEHQSENLEIRSFLCLTDDSTPEREVIMSRAGINTNPSRYAGRFIPAMCIGGVETDVQYRRQGCVRKMFETLLPKAREYGWYVSLLHPFSFSYYRKFGYERVSDHVIATFPITALDFLPRNPDLVPLTAERLPDLLELYNEFTKDRNVMFKRYDGGHFPVGQVYLYYGPSGKAEGYIRLEGENYFDHINRMVSVDLHVHEMGYLNRTALERLFSFVRMFEGEFDTVRLHDIGPLPEVDLLLKHYMHTRYDIRPDIMARVLDTEAMLKANTYPTEYGVFTLRVEDVLDSVRGTFRVEYQDGDCHVERLSDTSPVDIVTGSPSLSRFLYGTDAFDARLASYMDGVTIYTPAADFFRAFPKRINGLFEHF